MQTLKIVHKYIRLLLELEKETKRWPQSYSFEEAGRPINNLMFGCQNSYQPAQRFFRNYPDF